MQITHVPRVDWRYWTAIALASIFGTNLGDLYAHDSGLGLIGGVPVLLGIFALAYVIERFDKSVHQVWYWLAIIIIRTGATNIADYVAFRMHLNQIGVCVVLALIIAFVARRQAALAAQAGAGVALGARTGLPATDGKYWLAMLSAGVFGTVLGDVCSHAVGEGVASLALGAILATALLFGRRGLLQTIYYYWLTIAIARTTGTAIGDWLAESDIPNLGLTLSTIITGTAFVAVLLFWRSSPKEKAVLV
jgi:uncharacterized membrane-anchored protein